MSWKFLILEITICYFLITYQSADSQPNSCSLHTCKPPKCRCPAHAIPGNLHPDKVPQMVLISFDDAVNWENWQYYLRLFPPDGSRRNPNGCPISATFFVSHNFTDYCMVRKLHARGMEIGDHSVTHKLPRKWWTEADRGQMAHEVLTQKRHLVERAHIPSSDIKGWRSPFLQPAGDELFSLLVENNFTYDATMTYSFPKNLYSPVLWPFTLDFGYTLVCNIARCPQRSYPGFWIVPVVVLMDYREQKPCAYVDDCANMPRDQHEAYQMLWKNFLRSYRSNRAPLYLNLHSPWLNTPYHLEAMDQFISKMVDMDDVYLVTVNQALQWQMEPTPLDQLHTFGPWQCPGVRPNIEDQQVCSFVFKHKSDHTHRSGHPTPWQKSQMAKTQNDGITSGGSNDARSLAESTTNMPKKKDQANVSTDPRQEENEIQEKLTEHKSNTSGHTHGIRHNHDHRKHKPWFLKNAASNLSNFVFIHIGVLSILALISVCNL